MARPLLRCSALALLGLLLLPASSPRAQDAPDPAVDMPRTHDATEPVVGMTRAQFGFLISHSDVRVLSDVGSVVALEGREPGVEFERYIFTLPTGVQPARLWEITIAYRMPADRASFDQLENRLTGQLGEPSETVSRAAEHGAPPFERRVWATGRTAVTLVGCPDGETTDESMRMQVVTDDLGLRRIALAQRRPAKPHSS